MPGSASPLVSIVMPAYNSASFIGEALDSCLAQTYSPCEMIVVDDGSTDGTRDLLTARYGDRIRYFFQPNAGAAAARNQGIRAARGEFVQFCDADDRLLPAKIERCVAAVHHQPDVGVVYTRYRHVLADGRTPAPFEDPPLLSGDVFCDLLLSNANAILTSACLVRRDALLAVGLFDEQPGLRCSEDWDLFLRLAAQYQYASLDEVLVLYRRHPGELTASPYWSALGRLITVQKARHYPGRARCLDDAAYDQLEAGRHHMLGIACWEIGRRADARRAFRQANQLDPAHTAARRLYIVLSYVFPARVTDLVNRLRVRVKKLVGRASHARTR